MQSLNNHSSFKILMGTDEKGVKSALATVEEKSGNECMHEVIIAAYQVHP